MLCYYFNSFLQQFKSNSFPRLTKSKRVEETGFLSKICGKMFMWSTKNFLQGSHFKPVGLLYCGSSVAT